MSNTNTNTNSDMCYKKCGDYIVTMKKLPDTRTNESRSNVVDRLHAKFRADKLFVLSIEHETTGEKIDKIENTFYGGRKVCYIVSHEVSVEDYDPDLDKVCAAGIHYFLSRESAFYWNIDSKDDLDGPYRKWYENGQKWLECTYKNGVKHGLCQIWYESGQKYMEYTYQNGFKHGDYQWWYDNGQIANKYTYQNGILHGLYLFWYENGQKWTEFTYKNGEKYGDQSWHRNGKKMEECTY